MDASALREIGLTDGEAKVYLALAKIGLSKTGPLAASAGVSYSKVYKILARLELKGLATHVIKGGVKHFSASEPKRLLDYLEDEQNKIDSRKVALERMLPSIEKQFHSVPHSEAVLFTGFKAVTNVFRNLLDELNKGDTYCIMGVRYFDEVSQMRNFFHKYHQMRALKGIKVKMIANYDMREKLVKPTMKFSDVRYFPKELGLNINVLLYNGKTFINTWENDTISVLIQNKTITDSMQRMFDEFWKNAEK